MVRLVCLIIQWLYMGDYAMVRLVCLIIQWLYMGDYAMVRLVCLISQRLYYVHVSYTILCPAKKNMHLRSYLLLQVRELMQQHLTS